MIDVYHSGSGSGFSSYVCIATTEIINRAKSIYAHTSVPIHITTPSHKTITLGTM